MRTILAIAVLACYAGPAASQQPSSPTRAQQLAASFNKHKDVVRQKLGVTKAKYLDVRSEPLVTQSVKDYAGVYEVADLGYAIEIEVGSDGSVAAHGTDGTRGGFRLQNARIEHALLTGRTIYSNGQAERFEGVFLTRIQRESRSDPGSRTVGLGIVLSTPFEFGENTYERLFYQLKR